mmetsp:Transcript_80994/g.188155  ORF Transcript_80994/g.188155 Transcript_80994/m.188155 type:complete len:213 (+) Transcript_80994:448-1086(+)
MSLTGSSRTGRASGKSRCWTAFRPSVSPAASRCTIATCFASGQSLRHPNLRLALPSSRPEVEAALARHIGSLSPAAPWTRRLWRHCVPGAPAGMTWPTSSPWSTTRALACGARGSRRRRGSSCPDPRSCRGGASPKSRSRGSRPWTWSGSWFRASKSQPSKLGCARPGLQLEGTWRSRCGRGCRSACLCRLKPLPSMVSNPHARVWHRVSTL